MWRQASVARKECRFPCICTTRPSPHRSGVVKVRWACRPRCWWRRKAEAAPGCRRAPSAFGCPRPGAGSMAPAAGRSLPSSPGLAVCWKFWGAEASFVNSNSCSYCQGSACCAGICPARMRIWGLFFLLCFKQTQTLLSVYKVMTLGLYLHNICLLASSKWDFLIFFLNF